MAQLNEHHQTRTLMSFIAWRNVLGATLVAWLIIALPNFGFLTNFLARTMQHNLVLASLYLDLGFLASAVIVIGLIAWWQRTHRESLADIGWGRPTTLLAIIIAILFGVLWTAISYLNTRGYGLNFLSFPWERLIMAPSGSCWRWQKNSSSVAF